MASQKVSINTRPVAAGYATEGETIIEYSSAAGGGLISFTIVDGRLKVVLYRHDATVDIRVGKGEADAWHPTDDDTGDES